MTSFPFLVVGAAHWDIVARAAAPLGPGADVPGRVERRPGGVALNVALGLAAAGQRVELVAALGSDAPGDALAALARGAGVGLAGVSRHAGQTDAYVALETEGGALHAAVADCAGLERTGASVLGAVAAICPSGRWHGTVVADGNLPPDVLPALATLAAGDLALVPASPAKAVRLGELARSGRAALYLNRAEAEAVAGRAFPDSRTAALALLGLGARRAVVTDGARAATHADATDATTLDPPPQPGGSVTGAGDRFVAGHLAALAAGAGAADALRLALEAAARHMAGQTTIPDGGRGR